MRFVRAATGSALPQSALVKNASRTSAIYGEFQISSYLLHPWCTSWLIYSIDSGGGMPDPYRLLHNPLAIIFAEFIFELTDMVVS